MIFKVDDCRKTYSELVEKGVEFTQEPTEHFYGIDCGLRDPFGNPLRITQPATAAPEDPDARGVRRQRRLTDRTNEVHGCDAPPLAEYSRLTGVFGA